jgi:hypothetical protein
MTVSPACLIFLQRHPTANPRHSAVRIAGQSARPLGLVNISTLRAGPSQVRRSAVDARHRPLTQVSERRGALKADTAALVGPHSTVTHVNIVAVSSGWRAITDFPITPTAATTQPRAAHTNCDRNNPNAGSTAITPRCAVRRRSKPLRNRVQLMLS